MKISGLSFVLMGGVKSAHPSLRAPKEGAAIQQEKSQARQNGSGLLRFARKDKCFHAVIASPQRGRGNPAREKPGPSKRLWIASLRSQRQMLLCRHCEPPKGARQSSKKDVQPVKTALGGFASLAKTNAFMPSLRAPKGGAAIQQEKSQARQNGSGWLRFARKDRCFLHVNDG